MANKRQLHVNSSGAAASRPLPSWLLVAGGVSAAVLAYVGARGPQTVVQELKEAGGSVEAPRIISLQPTSASATTFIVSVKNPSLRQIEITGYIATPAIQDTAYSSTGAGALPVIDANDEPAPCTSARRVAIARPLVIDAGSAGGLTVKPWTERCDFTLSVEGTSGVSHEAKWTPELDKKLCEIPTMVQQSAGTDAGPPKRQSRGVR